MTVMIWEFQYNVDICLCVLMCIDLRVCINVFSYVITLYFDSSLYDFLFPAENKNDCKFSFCFRRFIFSVISRLLFEDDNEKVYGVMVSFSSKIIFSIMQNVNRNLIPSSTLILL